MDNFCGHCGSRLNPRDGTCPKCNKRKNKTPIILTVLVILVALIGITVCILRGNVVTLDEPEQEETTKQLSQIRYYDSNNQLRKEIDFTYEQHQITHIKVKSFDERGLKSNDQEYPIEYDDTGRVIRYGIDGLGRYEDFEYDEEGVLIRHGAGEGGYVDTFYEYDDLGRLEETLTAGDGADYVSHYVYDNTGKCIRRDDYTYFDATYYENRTYDLNVHHYRYDESGNLIEISGDLTNTTYTYDNLGRKSSEVMTDEYGFIHTTLFCYDYANMIICDINHNNNDDFNEGYISAEIRNSNGFLIFSYVFDTDSVLSADDAGYLCHIEEQTGARSEFLYLESE